MGTVIFSPQDCLPNLFGRRNVFRQPYSTNCRNRNPKPNYDSTYETSRTRRRKRSPMSAQSYDPQSPVPSQSRSLVIKFPAKNLLMGQVKILKRGEPLGVFLTSRNGAGGDNRKARVKSEALDFVLGSTDRLGPDPEMLQKQIRVSDRIYAGSTYLTSPPPSSVPLPGFIRKNGAATSDLRRLLRLDLV